MIQKDTPSSLTCHASWRSTMEQPSGCDDSAWGCHWPRAPWRLWDCVLSRWHSFSIMVYPQSNDIYIIIYIHIIVHYIMDKWWWHNRDWRYDGNTMMIIATIQDLKQAVVRDPPDHKGLHHLHLGRCKRLRGTTQLWSKGRSTEADSKPDKMWHSQSYTFPVNMYEIAWWPHT